MSGSWDDATKWSLGHVPALTEDVTITVAGNYAVSVPATPAIFSLLLRCLAMANSSWSPS